MRHGGWANRPGTSFVGQTRPVETRLIPFVYNPSLAYVLEFTEKQMRVIKDGDYIKTDAIDMLGWWAGYPTEPHLVVANTSPIAEGDTLYIEDVPGAPKNMAGRYFIAGQTSEVPLPNSYGVTAQTVQVKMMDSSIGDKSFLFSGYPAYGGSGELRKVYQIATPYLGGDLADLQYVQSGDTVTLAHNSYDPKKLTMNSDADWTMQDLAFSPGIERPSQVWVSVGPSGSSKHKYIVTAVKEGSYEESIPAKARFTEAKAAGSDGAPIVLSNPQKIVLPSNHGFEVGDKIYVELDAAISGLKGSVMTVVATETDSISINFDGTKYTEMGPFSYKTGDHVVPAFAVGTFGEPKASDPIRVDWDPVDGAVEYNVYKEVNGVYGLIGVGGGDRLNDIGVSPDTSVTPPFGINPFAAPGDKPGAVTYIQQRLVLGNTKNDPQQVITSRTAEQSNFTQSKPIQDSDSIRFSIAGRQRNEVNHMLDLGKLVILTSGGEWSAEGDAAGILRPTDINLRQHSYNGSNKLSPLVVDGSALYVQGRGSIVRDLGFSYQVDGYQGNDLTIFASHLFDEYTLVDWAYQQTPNSIVWAVRSDGSLLGLTLVREQQLLAWHRHTFQDGKVKAIASVPNGTEDEVYLSIEREIGGETVRFLEKLNSRKVSNVVDCVFMDSTVSYDGRRPHPSVELTIQQIGSDGFSEGTMMLLASSEPIFKIGGSEVGKEYWINYEGGVVKCSGVAVSTTSLLLITADQDIPTELQEVPVDNWDTPTSTMDRLHHLEGEEVAVFADGFVVANPINDDYTKIVVEDGKIELPRPAVVCHVGLPYMSDIETLNIDTAQGESLSNKKMNIQHVTAFVENSRGMWAGAKPPKNDKDDPTENLRELKIRDNEGYNSPISLKTGKVDINIKSEWNSNGRVFIRQIDPLPLSILSIFPSGYIPYR